MGTGGPGGPDAETSGRRRSIFHVVALAMAGLGLLAGVVFPLFVVLLGVPPRTAFRPVFVASCFGAGLGVAAGNYTIVKLVIGKRLRLLVAGMARLHTALLGCGSGAGDCADLVSCRLDGSSPDEIGASARSFNRLLDAFVDAQRARAAGGTAVTSAVSALRTAGDRIGSAAGAAVEASRDASSAAGRVGDAVRAVTRCADLVGGELTATGTSARELVGSADAVSGAIDTARTAADAVGASTGAVLDAMGAIEGIARQIRLLAINASLEATRAGGATAGHRTGAGFGVVAGEIGALAERTASTTADIAERLADNRRLVAAMGTSINELVAFAAGVRESQLQIAARLVEQQHAIEEIVRASALAERDSAHIVGAIEQAATATGLTAEAAAGAGLAVDDLVRTAAGLVGEADREAG